MDKDIEKAMEEMLADAKEKHSPELVRVLEMCFGAIRAGSSIESVVGLLNWITDTKKRGDMEILTTSPKEWGVNNG